MTASEDEAISPEIISQEESGLRLSKEGEWFWEDEPFENQRIIEFFHRAIRKDEQGRFYLTSWPDRGKERVYFQVEDAAYMAKAFFWDEERCVFVVRLNTGEEAELDIETLKEDARGVLRGEIRGGDLVRFTPKALLQLADHASMDDHAITLDKAGKRVVISAVIL